MIFLLIVFIRTAILYLVVVFVMRLMGKRQIGELEPYELVITMMISDLASLPMQDTRFPLLLGIVPIVTLLMLKLFLTKIQLKFHCLRKIIDGEPTILIHNGKLNYAALKNQQINIDELFEELRLLDYFDIDNIEYAILETNGKISVLPRDNSNAHVKLPRIIISDGVIITRELDYMNKDTKWLNTLLHNYNISSPSDVMIGLFNTKGEFKYQLFTNDK